MTTQSFSLKSDRWVDLGPTPCLLQNRSREAVCYVLGTAEPTTLDAASHVLNPVGSTSFVSIPLAKQRVFARAMWTDAAIVAVTPDVAATERFMAIASFQASALAPLAAGKLTQTLPALGTLAGDVLVATARTPLPAGITLSGEVTVPAAGKVTLSFTLTSPIAALAATPVAIELTPLR